MAVKKTPVKKTLVKKSDVDPILEAQNLVLEVEQAEQDIKDEITKDMIRANAEHAAIMKKNTQNANQKRGMDIHMANKAIEFAQDTLRVAKNGQLDGRHKDLIDLMYSIQSSLEEEKVEADKIRAKRTNDLIAKIKADTKRDEDAVARAKAERHKKLSK